MEIITILEDVHNCTNKEWPGVQENDNDITIVMPELLIMELGRLVPFMEGEHVRFFPINMPTIQIGCIHIIGLVLEVSCNLKQYLFKVDDGTGILDVKCNFKHFGITQEANQRENQVPKDDPKAKDLLTGNYVHLQGFLSLSQYKKSYKNYEEKNPLKRLIYGQPVFYAVNLEIISEEQYYKKMYVWLKQAKRRYT